MSWVSNRVNPGRFRSFVFFCILCVLCDEFSSAQPTKKRDPAAWGGDHVGQTVPAYVTGDECLFCHRNDVGPGWSKNRHQLTIRDVDSDAPALAALEKSPGLRDWAKEVKFLMGNQNRQRFLKPNRDYGKLDLLSVEWAPAQTVGDGKLVASAQPHWDGKQFANTCAGCHCTGVDPRTRAFSALGLDCYTCHGLVDLKHSKDPSLVHLSKKRKDPAQIVTSICGQCHVRTGASVVSGLPYPNNFVAGDNLFRDFRVDFSSEAIGRLNPADRHVLENIREVVLFGQEEVTCLSCHDVHQQSTKKHRALAQTESCLSCHNQTGSKKIRKAYEVHSQVCGY